MSTQAFFAAVIAGDADAVRSSLAEQSQLAQQLADAELTPGESKHWTALHLAAYHGRGEIERILIEAGADPDAPNSEGRTALHVAMEYNTTTKELLIELGATVDICAASALQRMDRVRELLSSNPSLANDQSTGLSPLGWCGFYNANLGAAALLDGGARIDDGSMHCAASTGSVGFGRVMLERGADPNELHPEDEVTALHIAAAMRYSPDTRPFIELLLDNGADVNAAAVDGMTPLDVAERSLQRQEAAERDGKLDQKKNYEGVIELLRARGGRSGASG